MKKSIRDSSEPIYNSPDKVTKIKDHLTRLMRQITYTNRVTGDMYIQMHHDHAKHLFTSKLELSNDRNNNKKPFFVDRVTWGAFLTIIQQIYNLKIVRLSLTVEDPVTKEEITYNSDDKAVIDPKKKIIQ